MDPKFGHWRDTHMRITRFKCDSFGSPVYSGLELADRKRLFPMRIIWIISNEQYGQISHSDYYKRARLP